MLRNPNELLAPHRETLVAIVEGGFRSYSTEYAGVAHAHSKTARANVINSHMVDLAKRNLPGCFHLVDHRGRKLFTLEDLAVIQFKRLDKRLMPKNYQTPTNRALYDFGSIDGLNGIRTSLPFITIGYVPDETWLEPLGVFATQIIQHKPAWYIRLNRPSETQLELSAPTSPHEPSPHRSKARLKTPPVPETIIYTGGIETIAAEQARTG